ncbi:FAD-dependent monooxygenase [Frankia sp. AgKG'84/4]|uniref:FAD-dependent monooxygenase n=1 Tax=Frankia sp. AgKG'84/4 TaxID=573490 RepID=UPI00201074FD|nr:FAD-dependent monooxygenase [Frankia sp. AgKG'84/4]MCL9793628.1 FAD-dependent monooxygenase [Frankia sp. AgKG'84/4]
MPAARKALVIGSGIAGPATAMALRKAGIDAAVFEARPAEATSEGAFLTVASNGVDALRVLGAEKVLAPAFTTPYLVLRSGTGKHLGRTRTGIELPDGATSQTITRSELYRGMQEAAAARSIEVEYGHRLVSVEETASGIRARFGNGREVEGDVLIGCDGTHSTVRELIDPRAPRPAYSGLVGTGGYVREVPVDSEPGHYEMIFGKRAFFGYVLAPDRSVWWFANIPRTDEPSRVARGDGAGAADTAGTGADDDGPDGVRRQLIDLFAGDVGPAVALIEATARPLPLSPIHTLAHLPSWHRGRSVVVGDAAHAPSPSSGQGASLSIEDALVLAQCLRDLPDHQQAFEEFVARRRARVEQIIRWAARINSNKAAGPLAAAIRDRMLPPMLRLTANNKAATRQFAYHVDWNAPAEQRAG